MLLQHDEEHREALLSRTVTEDETRVFHYTSESKDESSSCSSQKEVQNYHFPGDYNYHTMHLRGHYHGVPMTIDGV
jgi:hypothetical protein